MDNQFENKGKDQNVAHGDGAIGKQVNITQQVTGNNNVVTGTGTGDIHVHPEPAPVIPRQLPYIDACFLGRDKELVELVDHLHPGKVVAVCGPGGMGKSALAAQAVHKLEQDRFPDGIIFHSFYHQSSTDMLLQNICQAFKIEVKARLETAVQTALAGKKTLLILDGAEEAEDLKAVLDLRSTCGVLITSRKRSDAQKIRLDLQPLEDKPAVDIFCEYSGATENDASVQGVCEILDGWPVGLRIVGRYVSSTGESAADYLRWLEQEPFKELGDGEHQEENAALLLQRSVAQVSGNARQALSLFGVLAFEPVSRASVASVLDENIRCCRLALNELVTYGLLEKRKDRWQVSHALVHIYARTELTVSKENLERLAAYYIDFCKAQSKAGLEGYARLDEERAHCLRLMESCLDKELWQEVQGLVKAILEYLDRQGWWTDWLIALEMRLTATRKTRDRKGQGECLNDLGYTYERRGEREKALAYCKRSLQIRREVGDKQGEGETMNNIAMVYRQQGKHELALQTFHQSLSIAREVRNQKGEGTILNNIGLVYMNQGKWKIALPYLEQCLPVRRKVDDKIGEGITLNNIAEIYRAQNDVAKAIEYRKQSLTIWLESGDRDGEAATRWYIGLIYEDIGDLAKAEEYMCQAVRIYEQIGSPYLERCCKALEQVRAKRRGM
ncbi:hypothetical protein KKHLCK_15985 [Candidatus Electrothrix laxa]